MATAGHALDLYGVHQLMRDEQEGIFRAGLISLEIDADVGRWPAG